MKNDRVILVDARDAVLGSESKENAHKFIASSKTRLGAAPRLAYSCSIRMIGCCCNSERRIRLRFRASGRTRAARISSRDRNRMRWMTRRRWRAGRRRARATVRKMKHELGIDAKHVPIDSFKFLTRLHYCAADEFAEHANQPAGGTWGEHEMDYILFAGGRAGETLPTAVNGDEIDDTKWVSAKELKKMMDKSSGLRWSPWFRIIAEKFLYQWWGDLDAALGTDKYVDVKTIHKVM